MVTHARQRRGVSRLGCLVQILFVAAVAYAGLLAGKEALAYYRFKDAMKNEARFASVRTDQEMRNRLRAFTDSVELPPAAKDINIVREDNHIKIWSEYDQVFKLPFNHEKIVHLTPSVERTF